MMETRNTPSKRPNSDCEELLELLPAYSLGVATSEEEQRVKALLPGCPEAVAVLGDYQTIGESLLTMIPTNEAPPSSAALLQRVRAKSAPPVRVPDVKASVDGASSPARPPVSAPQPMPVAASVPTPRRNWGWLALAACLLLAFVGTNVYWASQLDSLRRDQQTFLQTLAASQTQTPLTIDSENQHRDLLPNDTSTQQTNASFVWNSNDQIGALVVDGLPALKPGETYQLWLVNDQQSLSLGTFEVDSEGTGVLIFHSSQPVETFSHIGVNIEPEGGTSTPTTPHLIIGNI